ncbi:hypothetical protein ACR9PT_05975 [Piscirickettsia salmonis]|uniref:hypothetical protein n=1 Tax=Piscirickettsia salmonis TaxID=1238 RepID=UPI003EBA0B4C
MARKNQGLSVYGLGWAIGIVWGMTVVILAWLAVACGKINFICVPRLWSNFLLNSLLVVYYGLHRWCYSCYGL